MKKLILLSLLMALTFGIISCDNKEDEKTAPKIEWNVNADASGEGYLKASFPTGNIVLDGAASVAVCSSNDSIVTLTAPEGAPYFRTVLANPDSFDIETVEFSNKVDSAIKLDSMSGTWNVNLTGYAKYGQIYVVIDEHWPAKQDSVIVLETDSL